MKLIDRYVYDVVRRLPEEQRDDVARELKAEIGDMVESRAAGNDGAKQHVFDVLSELGSPSQLADRYRERPRFLIGPEYFESYISILKTILAIVLPILGFVLLTTKAMTSQQALAALCVEVFGGLLTVSVHIFFWTTLSFVFVERIAAGRHPDQDWTPDDLPELPPEQEITRGESYFAIAWSVFAVIASAAQIPAIHELVNWSDSPQFFSTDMWPYWTIGLVALSTLGLLSEIIKLMVGGWTKSTVLMITAVNVLTVVFFVSVLYFVPQVANPELLKLIGESFGNSDISNGVATGIRIFVYVVVVICIWEVAEAIYRYKKGGKQ